MESLTLTNDTFGETDEWGNNIFTLITDSQDITATLESIGRADLADEVGLLFVAVSNGDYDEVWYSTHSVAWLGITLYQIYPN